MMNVIYALQCIHNFLDDCLQWGGLTLFDAEYFRLFCIIKKRSFYFQTLINIKTRQNSHFN